jgi:ACR3 family arsenite transporter
MIFYSPMAWFFVTLLSGWMEGLTASMEVSVSIVQVAESVLIYLGIPFVMGFLTRFFLVRRKGADWYDNRFMAKLAPTSIIGLLFTVVIMFSYKGDKIIGLPLDVLRIAVPLILNFLIMFSVSFYVSKRLVSSTRRRRRWPSPPPATTSSWQ